MENQFTGMTLEPFTYKDFERTRENLRKVIQQNLTVQDKQFLLSAQALAPDWSIYNFQAFPAIRWKLQNLERLKNTNVEKHRTQSQRLQEVLSLPDKLN